MLYYLLLISNNKRPIIDDDDDLFTSKIFIMTRTLTLTEQNTTAQSEVTTFQEDKIDLRPRDRNL